MNVTGCMQVSQVCILFESHVVKRKHSMIRSFCKQWEEVVEIHGMDFKLFHKIGTWVMTTDWVKN